MSDIEDVRRTESRRSRRPIDLEQQRRKKQLEKALRDGSLEDFKAAMLALGWPPGSVNFEQAMKIWRGHRES